MAIHAVALRFGKLPHEVREMTVEDFVSAVAFLRIVDDRSRHA